MELETSFYESNGERRGSRLRDFHYDKIGIFAITFRCVLYQYMDGNITNC